VIRRAVSCVQKSLLLGLWILSFVSLGAAAEAKRVLIVHSFGNVAPPFTTHSTAFETELTAQMRGRVDLDEVTLDVARYSTLDMEEALIEFLQKRQARWQPDLVVPIGSPAGVFVARYRDRLFSQSTPIIYAGMDQRRLPADALAVNAAFVGESFDLPGLVDDILQLQPATTNIAVVIGASPLERYWAEVLHQEYQRFTNRVKFTWLNEITFDQMLHQTANQPPHSFILLILLMRDAAGVTHDADEALSRMHAVANAPINSIFHHQLGLGIVGGRLYQAELEGIEAARIAVRVLGGEAISNFPPRIIAPLGPQYDWRELQRWGISEQRLPAGSVMRFRQPGVWQRYRWPIAGAALVCLLQAALILGLLLNRARRLRAESAAQNLSQRLIRAHEEERSRLARELHDDLTQRVARMAIDVGRVERGGDPPPPGEVMRSVREGLVGLSEDIHALSYRLHPSILEELGLTEALKAECERFSRQESIPTSVSVRDLPAVAPDAALCLFRVVQESLRNVARHAHARSVSISTRTLEEGLELAVRDDGVGMDRARRDYPSLGLASMRERVRLAGGEFEIDSAPGQGTTILVWVPLKQGPL